MNKLSYLKGLFWILGLVSIIAFYFIANNKVQSLINENNRLGDSLNVLQKNLDTLYSLLNNSIVNKTDTNTYLNASFDTSLVSKNNNRSTFRFMPIENNADSYSWNFGDGESSDRKNPEHTFNSDKRLIYDVTLDLKKNGKYNQSRLRIILPGPKPDESASLDAAFDTLPVSKNNNSFKYRFIPREKNAKSYMWNFGDGGKSNSREPEHSFNSNNKLIYNVTLDIKKDEKHNQSRLRIELPQPIQIYIKLDSSSYCKQSKGKHKFILSPTGGVVTGAGVIREKNNDYYFQPSHKNVKAGKVTFTYKYNQETKSLQVNVKDCSNPVKPKISLGKTEFCKQDSISYKFTVQPQGCTVKGNGIIKKGKDYYFVPSRKDVIIGEVIFEGEYNGTKFNYKVKVNNCPKLNTKKLYKKP